MSASTNRLTAGTYDVRGNLTEYGGQRYDYDALSRPTALNGGFERYLYDGAGERVARLTSPNPGADYYTITPCRVLDTRTSPPSLTPGVPRIVQMTGGSCGIAADASGITGNLTVTNVALQGYLTLAPTGTSPPPGSLPYRPNITRANNFGLGLSGLGQLTLSSNMNADGIVDVSGYYSYPAPTWTLTLRDEADRLSSEYVVTSSAITRTKNYFHFGYLLVSTRDSGGNYAYYHSDHLGTPRLVTGALSETHNYHPFGQEITPLFGNQPLKFAAMERDQASGNDSDHARVCGTSTLGRFLSPDRVGGDPDEPQSWNRYAYARNNPLKYLDPDGQYVRLATDFQKNAATREAVRTVVAANPSLGEGGAFAVDAALSFFLPASPGEMIANSMPIVGESVIAGPTSGLLSRIASKLENTFARNLGRETVEAAARESTGQVVARKATGEAFDHVTKYETARTGVTNKLDQLKSLLNRSDLTGAERQRAQQLLSQYSKKLDQIEKQYQRALPCAATPQEPCQR